MSALRVAGASLAMAVGLALTVPAAAQTSGEVNVYSSRHYDADKRLFEAFTKETGIKINVVEADIGPLIERLQREGANSRADLLITADAGNLWRAEQAGLFQPVRSETLEKAIPARLRSPEGQWFALSERARVIMYNRERVKPQDLATYEALAEPKWKGKVLVRSSSNVYNQSLVSAMIAAEGVEKTEDWAKGLVANMARPPQGGDADQIKALAAGEGDVAIVNTYYLGRMLASSKQDEREVAAKVGVFFPNQNGRGAHVNISGAGVTKHAPNRDNALKLLEFLLTPEAQQVFAEGNHEYPVLEGVAESATAKSWGPFKADPLPIAQLGKNIPEAVKIMDRAGWR